MPSANQTTSLLKRLQSGDEEAAHELLPLVYAELHGLASHYMDAERAQHTLQPTALVHEAWLRLVGEPAQFNDRTHFVAVAARAMRRVLIDHARRRGAEKRGGTAKQLPLDTVVEALDERAHDLLGLEDALEHLERVDAQLVRIVELRFFAGCTLAEAAQVLGVSSKTIERGWQTAQAWLRTQLGGGPRKG